MRLRLLLTASLTPIPSPTPRSLSIGTLPIGVAGFPPAPLNQGKHQDPSNVAPPRCLLRTPFCVRTLALLLFVVLWGLVSCWAVSKSVRFVPLLIYGRGENHAVAHIVLVPSPSCKPCPAPLCLASSLFDSCTPGRTPLSIAGTIQTWCNVLGSLSALLRESDPAEQKRAAIDARSGDGVVVSRPHLLLSVAASNPPRPSPLPRAHQLGTFVNTGSASSSSGAPNQGKHHVPLVHAVSCLFRCVTNICPILFVLRSLSHLFRSTR